MVGKETIHVYNGSNQNVIIDKGNRLLGIVLPFSPNGGQTVTNAFILCIQWTNDSICCVDALILREMHTGCGWIVDC